MNVLSDNYNLVIALSHCRHKLELQIYRKVSCQFVNFSILYFIYTAFFMLLQHSIYRNLKREIHDLLHTQVFTYSLRF
jgi:hypothetical protein